MKKLLILIGIILPAAGAMAQQTNPGVQIKGKATKRSIKLRWAPNSPAAWQLANKYGYTLERIALNENGRIMKDPEKAVINNTPFKPASANFWTGYMDTDDYVAVAAQAIFGETFELTENFSSDLVQVINKSRELEQRFSLALFSADQSLKAAELSGLYYEDELIAPGTKYLYRIYANIPTEKMELDTGYIYLGLEDYKPMMAPKDVQALFDDRMAIISWDGALVEKMYNSFWVERSADGSSFEKISERPIVNTYQGGKPQTRRIIKEDSLPSNNKEYYYRVIGIDAFGDVSPPSDTVSGSGKPLFAFNARITGHDISENGAVHLNWSFPEGGVAQLKSFTLKRHYPKTRTYDIIREGIDPSARSFTDEQARSTNYYVLASTDIYGRGNESFPYLVQLEDSIPPVPPTGLIGEVDTAGLVYLQWDSNIEEDIFGYQLFKANYLSEQFIRVPGPVVPDTFYTDTIAIKNLTETIYYKMVALDKRFNPSDFSEVAELKKPDVIPPSAPVFKAISGENEGILVTWEGSKSEDLQQHILYRRSQSDLRWKPVLVIDKDEAVNFYLDKEVEHRTAYAYTIIAMDDAGLESAPADPVSLMRVEKEPYPAVEEVYYTLDKEKRQIVVSWSYEAATPKEFIIYRSRNGGPLRLMKTIGAEQQEILDSYTLNDKRFEYKVVASFAGGDKTRLAEGVKVEL